jgi:hypothetical protein
MNSISLTGQKKGRLNMYMSRFEVGTCNITTTIQKLCELSENIYYHFYKKERLKHLNTDDKRIPNLKITGDLFSLHIFFRDNYGSEHKITLDGTVFLNTLTITSITCENNLPEYNPIELKAYVEIFKQISSIGNGYIHYSVNHKPSRIVHGNVESYKTLLNTLFDKIPVENRKEIEPLFFWMKEC